MLSASGALIAGVASLGGLAFSMWKWRSEKRRRRQAENEIVFNRAALGFPDFVQEWDHIGEELCRLVEETEVDRILILRAWNGRLEPRWATAVYQLRQGGQAPITHVHIELDADYIKRIKDVVSHGSSYYVVDSLPDSAIKDIYRAEGVTASYWSYINSVETVDGQSTAVSYASFSTKEPEGMSHETQTRCWIVTGRLKGLAHQFDINTVVRGT